MSVKYCQYCGHPLRPNGLCSNCGAPSNDSSANARTSQETRAYTVHPVQPAPQPAEKNTRTNTLLYVLLAAVVVVGLLVVYLLLNPREKETIRVERVTEQAATSGQSTTTGTQRAAQPSQEDIIKARKRSLLADYEAILSKNQNEEYVITDLNGNGFPELWITYNVGKHRDYRYHVYHSEKGHAREIYSTPVGSLSVHGSSVVIDNTGEGMLTEYTYDGNRIYETIIDGNKYGYASNRSVPTTNTEPLRKAFQF